MTKQRMADRERARFAGEMAESFDDLRQLGLIDDATHKRTLRDLNRVGDPPHFATMTGSDIRALRERENVSQAYLARRLNLTPAHLSKLERGATRPTGALLAMLNLVQRRGLDAIL
jgi:putative transcriptional regulator